MQGTEMPCLFQINSGSHIIAGNLSFLRFLMGTSSNLERRLVNQSFAVKRYSSVSSPFARRISHRARAVIAESASRFWLASSI